MCIFKQKTISKLDASCTCDKKLTITTVIECTEGDKYRCFAFVIFRAWLLRFLSIVANRSHYPTCFGWTKLRLCFQIMMVLDIFFTEVIILLRICKQQENFLASSCVLVVRIAERSFDICNLPCSHSSMSSEQSMPLYPDAQLHV